MAKGPVVTADGKRDDSFERVPPNAGISDDVCKKVVDKSVEEKGGEVRRIVLLLILWSLVASLTRVVVRVRRRLRRMVLMAPRLVIVWRRRSLIRGRLSLSRMVRFVRPRLVMVLSRRCLFLRPRRRIVLSVLRILIRIALRLFVLVLKSVRSTSRVRMSTIRLRLSRIVLRSARRLSLNISVDVSPSPHLVVLLYPLDKRVRFRCIRGGVGLPPVLSLR